MDPMESNEAMERKAVWVGFASAALTGVMFNVNQSDNQIAQGAAGIADAMLREFDSRFPAVSDHARGSGGVGEYTIAQDTLRANPAYGVFHDLARARGWNPAKADEMWRKCETNHDAFMELFGTPKGAGHWPPGEQMNPAKDALVARLEELRNRNASEDSGKPYVAFDVSGKPDIEAMQQIVDKAVAQAFGVPPGELGQRMADLGSTMADGNGHSFEAMDARGYIDPDSGQYVGPSREAPIGGKYYASDIKDGMEIPPDPLAEHTGPQVSRAPVTSRRMQQDETERERMEARIDERISSDRTEF